MSRFFIDRPVFAWVVAIFIVLGGLLSLYRLPVEQYPNVGAPTININVAYPGASATTIEESVLSVIEREMNGIDGLDYMTATAMANGTGSLALTFKSGTNEDIAQVNVQNSLSQVTSRLPSSVTQNGITVSKSSTGFLMVSRLASRMAPGLPSKTRATTPCATSSPNCNVSPAWAACVNSAPKPQCASGLTRKNCAATT